MDLPTELVSLLENQIGSVQSILGQLVDWAAVAGQGRRQDDFVKAVERMQLLLTSGRFSISSTVAFDWCYQALLNMDVGLPEWSADISQACDRFSNEPIRKTLLIFLLHAFDIVSREGKVEALKFQPWKLAFGERQHHAFILFFLIGKRENILRMFHMSAMKELERSGIMAFVDLFNPIGTTSNGESERKLACILAYLHLRHEAHLMGSVLNLLDAYIDLTQGSDPYKAPWRKFLLSYLLVLPLLCPKLGGDIAREVIAKVHKQPLLDICTFEVFSQLSLFTAPRPGGKLSSEPVADIFVAWATSMLKDPGAIPDDVLFELFTTLEQVSDAGSSKLKSDPRASQAAEVQQLMPAQNTARRGATSLMWLVIEKIQLNLLNGRKLGEPLYIEQVSCQLSRLALARIKRGAEYHEYTHTLSLGQLCATATPHTTIFLQNLIMELPIHHLPLAHMVGVALERHCPRSLARAIKDLLPKLSGLEKPVLDTTLRNIYFLRFSSKVQSEPTDISLTEELQRTCRVIWPTLDQEQRLAMLRILYVGNVEKAPRGEPWRLSTVELLTLFWEIRSADAANPTMAWPLMPGLDLTIRRTPLAVVVLVDRIFMQDDGQPNNRVSAAAKRDQIVSKPMSLLSQYIGDKLESTSAQPPAIQREGTLSRRKPDAVITGDMMAMGLATASLNGAIAVATYLMQSLMRFQISRIPEEFSKYPDRWAILDAIAQEYRAFTMVFYIVRALLADSLGFWQQAHNRSSLPRTKPVQLDAVMRLARILTKARILQFPFSECSVLIPRIAASDIVTLLNIFGQILELNEERLQKEQIQERPPSKLPLEPSEIPSWSRHTKTFRHILKSNVSTTAEYFGMFTRLTD